MDTSDIYIIYYRTLFFLSIFDFDHFDHDHHDHSAHRLTCKKKIEKKWEKIRRPQRNLLTFAPSNDERSMCTPGTQHFLSGRREIATCPAHKNGRRKEDEKVKKYQSEKGKKNLQTNV